RDEATRRYPLDLPWPLTLEEHISAALPANFTAPAGRVVIDDPAFHYEREGRLDHGTLHIDHRYVLQADHVSAADYPRFLAASARVYQALGVHAQESGFSWQPLLDWFGGHLFVLAGAVAALGAVMAGLMRLRRP